MGLGAVEGEGRVDNASSGVAEASVWIKDGRVRNVVLGVRLLLLLLLLRAQVSIRAKGVEVLLGVLVQAQAKSDG
jgi:hypothetical protein